MILKLLSVLCILAYIGLIISYYFGDIKDLVMFSVLLNIIFNTIWLYAIYDKGQNK